MAVWEFNPNLEPTRYSYLWRLWMIERATVMNLAEAEASRARNRQAALQQSITSGAAGAAARTLR